MMRRGHFPTSDVTPEVKKKRKEGNDSLSGVLPAGIELEKKGSTFEKETESGQLWKNAIVNAGTSLETWLFDPAGWGRGGQG